MKDANNLWDVLCGDANMIVFLRNSIKKFCVYVCVYTGCPRRNVPNFGRVFLMLNYTDITQNTYIQSYGDNGHRKVWASGVSTYCTPSVTPYSPLRMPGNEM